MSDRLEDFINQNREDFDAYEPEYHIWDKIQLNEGHKMHRRITTAKIIWRAAAVITIFVLSYFVHDFISGKNNNNSGTVEIYAIGNCNIPDEVAETESYYINQVNVKLNELNDFEMSDPEIRKVVEDDFNELDNIYLELKNDLCEDVDNEEVLDAMIQNYRTKLQILEEILYKLKEIKNQENNNNHEYNL
ncbi:MAG: hypothetical protein ABIJ97_16850 [Bacteroidota bacterium]